MAKRSTKSGDIESIFHEYFEPGSSGESTSSTKPDSGKGQGKSQFRGTLKYSNGEYFLEAGGIQVVVEFEDDAEKYRDFVGKEITVIGFQKSATIIRASLGADRDRGELKGDVKHAPEELIEVMEVITKNAGRFFQNPAIVNVRPGYRFREGWITDEPAIIISVHPDAKSEDINEIRKTIERYPVETKVAGPSELLRRQTTDFEAVRAGEFYPQPLFIESLGLKSDQSELEVLEALPRINYVPPPDADLTEVTDKMNVICHVSPDTGWQTLKNFLEDSDESLEIGMYDYTAPHIYDTIRDLLDNSDRRVRLTLDSKIALPTANEIERDPDLPKANDYKEDRILRGLKRAGGSRFESCWASTSGQDKLFASSYHIKVAVKDDRSFWLSSGNWQSSNQPNIDFFAGSENISKFRKYNREWHVVIEHKGLSSIFQKYLNWDFEKSSELEEAVPIGIAMPDLLVPQEEFFEERGRRNIKLFPSRRFQFTDAEPLKVQPLLTPDNYFENVRDLVNSAREKLYFQNQSLNIVKPENMAEEFQELLDLLKRASNNNDLDTRIIIRQQPDVREKLESLKAFGFNMDCIKVQQNCHTKGIVVDSKTVLVGSHNWTSQGVKFNRDASLIFYNSEIASFFEEVFLFDWDVLARQQVVHETVRIDTGTESESDELIRMAWQDLYDES